MIETIRLKLFCTFCFFLHTTVLDFLNGTLEVLKHRETIYYQVLLGYPQSFTTTDSDFFPITKLLCNLRIQQTLKKGKNLLCSFPEISYISCFPSSIFECSLICHGQHTILRGEVWEASLQNYSKYQNKACILHFMSSSTFIMCVLQHI